MLNIDDYNYLKMLYEKLIKMNSHLKQLITKNEWDSVTFAIEDKQKIINQIAAFEKSRIDAIKENKELLNIRNSIVNLEKENIELVKSMKESLAKEYTKVNLTKKTLNAYEPSSNRPITTIDILDNE